MIHYLIIFVLCISHFAESADLFLKEVSKKPVSEQLQILERRISFEIGYAGLKPSETIFNYYVGVKGDPQKKIRFLVAELAKAKENREIYARLIGESCQPLECFHYLDLLVKNQNPEFIKGLSLALISELNLEKAQPALDHPKALDQLAEAAKSEKSQQVNLVRSMIALGRYKVAKDILQLSSNQQGQGRFGYLTCLVDLYTASLDVTQKCFEQLEGGVPTLMAMYTQTLKGENNLPGKPMKKALQDILRGDNSQVKAPTLLIYWFLAKKINADEHTEIKKLLEKNFSYQNVFTYLALTAHSNFQKDPGRLKLKEKFDSDFKGLVLQKIISGETKADTLLKYFGDRNFYYQVARRREG